MVNHPEPGQVFPCDQSHHLVRVVDHNHVALKDQDIHTNAKFKLNLTKPRALKLLKIWGSGVDASIVEGVGFITGLKSM